MAKSSTPNSSSSTYNVLSNNENLEGVRKQVIDGIKIDLLDTLKMDDIMVDRNKLANDINDNRRDNFVGHPVIDKLKLNNSHPVVKEDDYKDILDEYDSLIAKKEANNWPDNHAEFNKKLRELDTRLAERVILDNGLAIQFKSGERFEDGKNAEEESKIAYENLNKMELNGIKKYEGKIDWISEEKGETNYFIIKRKPEELALIKAALKAIDEVSAMKDEDIETLKAENKKNSDTITDLTQRIEELEKNKKIEDEKKQEEIAELKKKYEALEQGNQTEGTDTDGKNGESTTKKGTSTGTNNSPTNSEKTPAETTEQTSNEATKQPEKGYLTEEQIDKILDDKLKKYLAPLLEAQEKTTRKAPENKELNSKSRERSRESVETNPLYVSRKDVERSVLASRKNSDFPIGTVEIKGTYVRLEEFDFYEEIKQEYIFAKGDSVKLAELDKKLAELVILCSPRGVSVEQRYQIQLTEEEIIAGGLVVSQAFLAKYGLAVDFFEYTNTIIEREYQEKMETIREIETEITELTTIITELTRKITIEDSSSESIILEISKKREKVKILKDKMYALLLSLRKSGNKGIDKDLLALKEREKKLQEELNELKKQKEHQDEVNNRIKEIEEELDNYATIREKRLKEVNAEILELENKIKFAEGELENSTDPKLDHKKLMTDIGKWKEELKLKNKEKEKLEKELRQIYLEREILELENKIKFAEGELENSRDPKLDHRKLMTDIGKWKEDLAKKRKELEGYSDSELSKLRAELAKLKEEQKGFDKNIDEKITNKEKELADVREKIKNKEIKKVGLGEFEVGADGDLFAGYCRDNGITREDGTEIKSGADINTSAVYLKDGKRLKLEPRKGGAFGYDDGVRTTYEFVYYEESEPAGTDDLEEQLLIIIREQGELEAELEELEIKLKKEKSESIRIIIEEEIEKIQKKLLVIKQSIVNITNSTRKYKETITQHRYRVYKVRPIPIPDWKEKESFEMTSVISDMGTDVFREKASLKVEEKLKAYYKSLGRWQVGSRLALFLGRGRRRKRMIRNEMNNMANTAFQTGAGYGALNEQSQNAADRHGHELATGMEAINKITTVHNQQVDQLCKDYLNNVINDDQFQQQFNQIIANDANIQNILHGQNITHIGTNVLLRLQEQKALNQLILDMDAQLAQYVATGNVVHMDNMRNYVSQFIKDYQKTPAFMANFEQFVKGDLNARNQLRQYLNHQRAVMQMQITNLRMNIDILNKGKSAYQIDNKDREQGKGSWKFKLGHFMDKHPRGTVLSGVALSVGLGFLTAGTSAVVGAAISTGVFGAYVGTTNAVKKWTHHTKEQNTHEKNMATDYRNEQAKIQAWQNQALNGHGWRKYKAKRQLALYDQTTQENIKLSDQITEYITNLSSKVGPLTADEDNFMRCNLIEGWARLKYYRQMGHNFLASEQVDKTEKDMKRLEKAITLGLQKIGKTTNDIETNMTATNQQKTNITYAVIQNDLKASYDKSLIQFKRERRNLSLKYGIGTAAASIGGSLAFQYIFGTGVFTKETAPFNSTTTTAEYYNLGKHEGLHLTDSIANDTNSALSSVSTSDATGANLLLRYGGGTDATGFASTPPTSGNLSSKITAIDSYISSLPTKAPGATGPGLTATDKATFLSELHSLSGGTGTNGVLQNMRHADDIGQLAKGLSTSGKSGIFNPVTLTQDPALNVVGATTHTAGDRVANAVIEISKEGVPGKKSRFFGVPLFFNTFKDRKATKDTTDQNFGRGGQQQRQPQNP